MRILLDENLNWRLARELPEHDVQSVGALGWAGIQNGALLRRATAGGFEVLLTMDSNMVHQQHLTAHPIAVVVLRARSNRLDDTPVLMPAVRRALPLAPKGALTVVE